MLSVKDLNVKGKKVFLRVDFNVPLDEERNIRDDTRIKAALPTLNYLLEQGAMVIVASHLGRPKGQYKPEFSLKPVATRLSELISSKVILAPDVIGDEVEETGETFAENAIRKAREYARLSGLVTLADDSGLEVDALGGEPGVHSARYGEQGVGDEDRYQLLLHRMQGVPWEGRGARFRCVIAVAEPGGESYTADGTCEGVIAFEPQGQYGFGYDPIFYLPEYDKTMAQLLPEVKNRISHRARAAQEIRAILERILRR